MLITFEQLKKAVEALRDFILARIPKRTSELINDSDFVVKSEVPTKTTDLTNDSGFITVDDVVSPIDDTASSGDTDVTWSADKIASELENAGSVKDVKVNGTSIVDSETGEANIPMATASVPGVIRPGAGLMVDGSYVVTAKATGNQVKAGYVEYSPIVPKSQHSAAFYGLAKAAGADMKDSANPVGTYTDEAKTAIRTMLGVDDAISSAISTLETSMTEYTDNALSALETSLKKYTDDTNDTLEASLKQYTDDALSTLETSLKQYTDNAISTLETSLKQYIDASISSSINTEDTALKQYVDDAIAKYVKTTANMSVTGTTLNILGQE